MSSSSRSGLLSSGSSSSTSRSQPYPLCLRNVVADDSLMNSPPRFSFTSGVVMDPLGSSASAEETKVKSPLLGVKRGGGGGCWGPGGGGCGGGAAWRTWDNWHQQPRDKEQLSPGRSRAALWGCQLNSDSSRPRLPSLLRFCHPRPSTIRSPPRLEAVCESQLHCSRATTYFPSPPPPSRIAAH